MNALETAILAAFESEGSSKEANKAYLEFIKANFIIPIEISSTETEPRVLYLVENEQTFLPVFSSQEILQQWAQGIEEQIQLLKLTGVNLLKGIGDNINVSLNIGSKFYKEFNSAELARMKSMVVKFFGE